MQSKNETNKAFEFSFSSTHFKIIDSHKPLAFNGHIVY